MPSDFVARLMLVATIEPQPVEIASEQHSGPTVGLCEYRDAMAQRRLDSIGRPGMYLDESPTGSGKSTADLAAFAVASRSLVVVPTHENAAEVVDACLSAGIDAVAYPGRNRKGEPKNCWNPEADTAEALGLCTVAAVCNAGCEFRQQCVESGYLKAMARANDARVAISTHARSTHSGLAALSKQRDYVVLHEDCLDTLCPQISISANALEVARNVLDRLLNDPRWLDRFAPVWITDENGQTVENDAKATKRRDAQFRFFRHLADTVDRLIATASGSDTATEISVGSTLKEPAGVQAVLFRICQEMQAPFKGKPVWSMLFYTATGEFYRQGILIHERSITGTGENHGDIKAGRENHLSDAAEPAATEGGDVAVRRDR